MDSNNGEFKLIGIKPILEYYFGYGLKDKELIDAIKLNPFLEPYFTQGAQSIPKGLSISSITSSVGTLDVTSLADGFAKFIVKRTKQELNIAFFEKFKEELNRYPDIQDLFPQTYRTLSAIGEDIYMYEAYIMALRESFEKDLASLPSNLPDIIENHEDYFDQAPELKAELLTAFYMAEAIQDKQHPGEIIAYFDERILNSEPNAKAAFQTLKLFSTSLQSKNDSVYWVSEKEIKALINEQVLFNIYMGLVLQKAKTENIVFKNKDNKNIRLDSVLNKAHDDMQSFKIYLTTLASKTQQLETQIKGLKKIKSDSLLFENYYSIVSSSVDLMKYTIDEIPIPNKNELTFNNQTKSLKEITDVYFDFAQTGADIAIDVDRRNYSSAIINVSHIYSLVISKWDITTKEYDDTKEKIRKIINNSQLNIDDLVKTRNYKTFSSLSEQQIKSLGPLIDQAHYYELLLKHSLNDDTFDKIIKYGSFMAAITQAKSSDEVEAAIEAIALPTGSARIKRETNMNVSLNAYFGPSFGGEYLPALKTDMWASSMSFTAPIGIAFSWGNICNGKRKNPPVIDTRKNGTLKGGKSISLFLSVVDIGAITSYRFKDDSSSVSSKITLENIISPGLFCYYGFGKVPISLGIGAQLGPQLREISATNINVGEDYYLKIGASLVVDLPIINLYTKTDKYKKKKNQ